MRITNPYSNSLDIEGFYPTRPDYEQIILRKRKCAKKNFIQIKSIEQATSEKRTRVNA